MQATFNLSSQVHRRQQSTWGSDSVTSRAHPQSLLFSSSCRITRESKALQIGRYKPSMHHSPGEEPISAGQSLPEDLVPPSPLPPGGPLRWSLDDAESCTAVYDTDHTVAQAPVGCHGSQAQNYLHAGAVFVKWPFKGPLGPLGQSAACSHAQHLEVDGVRMLFCCLVVWWRCSVDRVNWFQVRSHQILHAPVSPYCRAAIWTPPSVLQWRRRWEDGLSLVWFWVYTLKVKMWKSDLPDFELAEVRVTEAALVGQQLSPPLQTPQGVIPGGHWPHPGALVAFI